MTLLDIPAPNPEAARRIIAILEAGTRDETAGRAS